MKELFAILSYICGDFIGIIQCFPVGVGVCGLGIAISVIYYRKSLFISKIWIIALLGAYLTVMLDFAFFSREPGSRTAIDLMPFSTWGTTAESRAYVIENILMFIPMGWLLPKVIGKLKKWHLCVAAGFVFSICLELAQLMTGRGYCQTDDVIMNTLGTGIGWLLSYKYNTKGK